MLSILLVSSIGITTLLNNVIPAGNIDQNYAGLHARPQFFGSYFHWYVNELSNNPMASSNSNVLSSDQYYMKADFPQFSPIKHVSYACHHPNNRLNILA
jgi:hypothetical protein